MEKNLNRKRPKTIVISNDEKAIDLQTNLKKLNQLNINDGLTSKLYKENSNDDLEFLYW